MSPRSTWPARASSTSPSTRPPRARWRRPWSTPVTRTGRGRAMAGERFNLEFVSANPTGPVHLGHVRWAAVGDALGRILEADRRRRDEGVLLQRRGRRRSTGSRGRCSPPPRASRCPTDGYAGAYIEEIAAQVVAAGPARARLEDDAMPQRDLPRRRGHGPDVRRDQASRWPTSACVRRLLQREGPARQGRAGRPRSPGSPTRGARSSRTVRPGCGRRRSATTRTASWSRATVTGPTSPPTAPTTWTSGERGFDKVVIMLGADHHGYIGRLPGAGRRPTATTPTRTSRCCSVSWSTCSRTASRCG